MNTTRARETSFKILDAAKGYVGKFDTSVLPEGWGLKYAADGVYLRYVKGLMILIR